MAKSRSKSPAILKIAQERIEILFKEAEKQVSKIAMRYNVKIPQKLKKKFCHKCHHYFLLGKNCKVRTNPKTKCVEYKCLDCGGVNRYGYSLEKA